MLLEKVQTLLQKIQKKDGQDSKRPVIQSPSVQKSRVQVYNHPESKSLESKRPVVQSPRVQSSRVQVSSRPESRAESKRPDHTPTFQFFRYAFLNIVIQAVYCNSFCNNVETSLSCWFIAAFHLGKLGNSKIDCENKIQKKPCFVTFSRGKQTITANGCALFR